MYPAEYIEIRPRMKEGEKIQLYILLLHAETDYGISWTNLNYRQKTATLKINILYF